jgi:hypothetical protein
MRCPSSSQVDREHTIVSTITMMNLSEMTLIVQLVLAPDVLLSAGSVMINGVFGHYQAINDRLRAMCRERLDLCSTSPAFDQLTLARLELIDLHCRSCCSAIAWYAWWS